jgi:hypothetical protein
MIKSILNCLKWTPFAVLLATAFILPVRSSTANDQPAPEAAVPDRTDLSNEDRVLGKYLDDLTLYEKECRLLGKRARLISADLDDVQRRELDLKNRLSEVQKSVGEVVRKLKAANQWNDLNAIIAAGINDPKERREFEELNFKKLLDDGSNSLTSHSHEIGSPLENLRKRLTSRNLLLDRDGAMAIVPAAYRPPPPPMFLVSVKCMISGIKRGIVGAMGNKSNNHSTDVWSCACHPENPTGSGTGAACSECC